MEATRGIIWVHSAAGALCPHIEWAISKALSRPFHFDWLPQPAEPGMRRAETVWFGDISTGEKLASALLNLRHLRFEVTTEPTNTNDGMRWTYTPSLGLHGTIINRFGDSLIHEERLRSALKAKNPHAAIHELLGTAWDDELEPFRGEYSGQIKWLHALG
ncbi:MAG: DUF3145 domain-containing protein [Propionibacteriaceae bacterium]|nr:DUF3145 domain-containing protein [Propionibacteriaceae bacterium]